MKRVSLLIILQLFASLSFAQVNRYFVSFTDKDASSFSVANPEAFLSQKTIDRRSAWSIAINENDLPVNGWYIDSIKNRNIDTFFASKWLNGVLVQGDSAVVSDLVTLNFIDSVTFVAKGSRLNATLDTQIPARNIQAATSATLTTDFQNNLLAIGAMHEAGFEGDDKVIAVLDGGFTGTQNVAFFDHLYTDNRLLHTFDYVTNSKDVYRYADHGTRVLSVISGVQENFNGTAPNADIILLVTEDVANEYRIEEYNWLFAAEFCDSIGVDVINTSLGYNTFTDPSMNYTQSDLDGETAIISRAAQLAAEKGTIVVCSAGNEGNVNWQLVTPPADAKGVIAVGATNMSLTKASFSSIGPTADQRIKPDIVAVGGPAVCGAGSGNIVNTNGTSLAAPQIAGMMAACAQAFPNLKPADLIQLVKESSSQSESPDFDLGFGYPNFNRLNNVLAVPSFENSSLKIFPNPNDGRFAIEDQDRNIKGRFDWVVYNLNGQVIKSEKNLTFGNDRRLDINLEDSAPGLYILEIINRKNKFSTRISKF